MRGKQLMYGYEEVAATHDEHVEGEGGTADRGGRRVRRRRHRSGGAAAVGLVLAEVRMARRHVGNGTSNHVPNADGRYGRLYATPANRTCA